MHNSRRLPPAEERGKKSQCLMKCANKFKKRDSKSKIYDGRELQKSFERKKNVSNAKKNLSSPKISLAVVFQTQNKSVFLMVVLVLHCHTSSAMSFIYNRMLYGCWQRLPFCFSVWKRTAKDFFCAWKNFALLDDHRKNQMLLTIIVVLKK